MKVLLEYINDNLSKWLPCIIFYGGLYVAWTLKQDGHTALAIIQGVVLFIYALDHHDKHK